MNSKNRKKVYFILTSSLVLILSIITTVFCQDQIPRDKYLMGPEQKLQIHVHIWGEVNKPGDYIVPDGTNVLELISEAGGPTQYADLSHVKVTREAESFFVSEKALLEIVNEAEQNRLTKDALKKTLKERFSQRVITINIKRYLADKNSIVPIPTLKPGDVVVIKQNIWYKWRTFVRIASEVAIIVSVYVWYLRAENN